MGHLLPVELWAKSLLSECVRERSKMGAGVRRTHKMGCGEPLRADPGA